MKSGDALFLGHMLDSARSAVAKVRRLSRKTYDEDENLRLALVYLIQTLGESARRVSEPTRRRYGSIPWSQIIAMRHRLVHDYMSLDFEILWQVVRKDLPPLIRELEKIDVVD